MDYLYFVDLKDFLSSTEICPQSDYYNCVVSSLNIAAISANCCIYILPLEKPNELKPIPLGQSSCINLAWSHDGQFLLAFFKSGQLKVFNIKVMIKNLVNF